MVAVNPRKYQLTLGMALYRRGQFDEALPALDEATSPSYDIAHELANEPVWLFPLAMAQWQLGRREAARTLGVEP